MNITKPTIRHARKVIEVVSCGLTSGKGRPEPGKMCVEAAVCYAFGLPHGDDPPCVGPAVRQAKITLNDSAWSSDQARAKGMIRVAVAQLGSDGIDQEQFAAILAELTIRRIVPIALRAAAQLVHKEALEAAAVRCETEGSREVARAAFDASRAAFYASDASRAASDASRATAYASDAAFYAFRAASDAAGAASRAAAYASNASDTRDAVLTQMANIIEEALTICGSPGCKWLFLLDDVTKN